MTAHGVTYAKRESAREEDLDVWERLRIGGAVKEELEQEVTGDETERDVESLVEDILDEELGEAEEEEGDE